MEIGAYTFADVVPDPATHGAAASARRLAELLAEAETAEAAGLDVFGVGEHHRPDFAVSSPGVVLGAIAARTSRIRLTSAVSVISSDDPVRVFQQFSTVDLLSGGRAEIMAGRGSFIESFPLFGQRLEDYDALFSEKLELLLRLRDEVEVTWPGGGHRPAIEGRGVYPRPLQDPLPIWVAVGGTPQSIVRAGLLGLPLALAIIGGSPERFAPLVELHRRALVEGGHDPAEVPVGINCHAFVAETSQGAADVFWPPYAEVMGRIGRERGWPALTREAYEAGRGPRGHLAVGTPDEVAEKLIRMHEVFGNRRFLLQMSVGPVPHADVLRSIELLGTEVAPRVRAAAAARRAAASAAGPVG